MSAPFAIRDSVAADVSSICDIYGHHVSAGFGSFELEPPTGSQMSERREEVIAKGLPYLVAVNGEGVLGFGYCGPYRTRPAYRFVVENSVYVAPDAARRGVGRALLVALIERCERLGLRQMIAVIGDSNNQASIGLHRALGFEMVGTLQDVGHKRGRWLDTVFMQRRLGEGSSTSPEVR